jgi:DNA ligase-1
MIEMNWNKFKPMLAFDGSLEFYLQELKNSDGRRWWWSYKIDGIRSIVMEGGTLRSRSLKPIRNKYTQQLFGRPEYEGLDGELVVGSSFGEGVFARTSSGVMSEGGEPDVKFLVFDDVRLAQQRPNVPYSVRYEMLEERVLDSRSLHNNKIVLLEQSAVSLGQHLINAEGMAYELGYEGIMLRDSYAGYKYGRSTARERGLGKLKRVTTREAVIKDFQERMHNGNVPSISPTGYQVRSSHQDNLVPMDTLGALFVTDFDNPSWSFNVGTGFDLAMRKEIWQNKEKYRGKIIRYKYLPYGTLEAPRHPVFMGFRDIDDL